MTGHSCDRALDELGVARVVGAQFPELRGAAVRRLGAGWDNESFVIGDEEWVFRFPKRAEGVPWLLREVVVVGRVSAALGAVVPRFEHVGAPSGDFPYPFVGYRFVRGVDADHPDVPRLPLAREIGGLLRNLHAIDPSDIPAAPAGSEERSVTTRVSEISALAPAVAARLPESVATRAVPYLLGEVPAPPAPRAEANRLCHNDICAEHLLVDPTTGQIAGLLDWTDAMVTDPLVDFVGLITIGGYGFIGDVVSAYESSGGEAAGQAFWERLVWWCRVLTLIWLGEALGEHSPEVDRHLAWVERAFAER